MARTKVQAGTGADLAAATMAVEFSSSYGAFTTLTRWATDVVMVSGETPSYACFAIPQLAEDEQAGNVAAAANSSPKLRTRARINFVDNNKSYTMMSGTVIRYDHDVDSDSIVGVIQDDRYWLTKITVYGRVKCDPVSDKNSVWFDSAEECVFEPLSCVDSGYGPVFAPCYKYGWNYDELGTMPTPGQATARARNWRCVDIMEYLRNVYCNASFNAIPSKYGNYKLPRCIQWPRNIADGYNWTRWATGFDAQQGGGNDLCSVLQALARKAGPFDIYFKPSGFSSILCITDMSGRKSSADLYMPRYKGLASTGSTIAQRMSDTQAVQGGSLVESVGGYFDDVAILGDPPAIERSIDTLSTSILRPAWSTADEDAFKKYVKDNGEDSTAFIAACDIWPNVYACWHVDANAGKIFPDASKWKGNDPKWRASVKEHLLTGYNSDGNANTYGSNTSTNNPMQWRPLEIPVEYSVDTGSNWKVAERLDGLAMDWSHHLVFLDGLRRKGNGYTWNTQGGESFDTTKMRANDMRLTIAIEGMHRIVGRGVGDPNWTSSRVEQGNYPATWAVVAQPLDYVDYERSQSHPFGQVCDEPYKSQNYPDKLGSGNELYSDAPTATTGRLYNHANARLSDVKRISYMGSMAVSRCNPALEPGMCVNLKGSVLERSNRVGAVIKTWSFSVMRQQQLIELVSDDRGRIYDVPTSSGTPTATPPQQTGAQTQTGTSGQSSNTSGPDSGSTGRYSGGSGSQPSQQQKDDWAASDRASKEMNQKMYGKSADDLMQEQRAPSEAAAARERGKKPPPSAPQYGPAADTDMTGVFGGGKAPKGPAREEEDEGPARRRGESLPMPTGQEAVSKAFMKGAGYNEDWASKAAEQADAAAKAKAAQPAEKKDRGEAALDAMLKAGPPRT